MADLATAYVQIIPSAQGMKQKLSNVLDGEMPSAGQSAGGLFGSNLISTIKKALVTAGIGEALKKTITEGAALEQSLGGIETLFKDSADTVIANAKQAYQTSGMSANGYMEQVTSFSASLLQSLGGDTTRAASVADMALTDMSDNANKFGTNMERITDAYQGFAKQNYTMLDNLKLGYGGTKTEMQRLLKDAETLTGVKYDISNLSDVYNAIHAIQENLHISGLSAEEAAEMVKAGLMTEEEAFEALGTTAKEAATTLSGSFNSMKAAFSNVLGNLALGEAMGPSLNALAKTTITFLVGNLLPAITNIVTALPGALVTFITALLPGNMQEIATVAISQFSAFMTEGLPTILSSGEQLMSQLVAGIQNSAPSFLETAGELIGQFLTSIISALPRILNSGVQIITELTAGLLNGIPTFLAAAASLLSQLFVALVAALPSMLQSGTDLVLNLASGLLNALPNVINSAITIIADLLAELASHLPELLQQGIELICELAAGLIQAIPDVVSAAGEIISTAAEEFTSHDWFSIGSNIISGIANGIKNGVSSIISAAKGAALSAYNAAKNALGIQSPSRLFRDGIGRFIPEGMALGIRQNAGLVSAAMKDLSANTLKYNLRMDTGTKTVPAARTGATGKVVSVVQNIYSEAKTAADLMQEARYQQELAVMFGV